MILTITTLAFAAVFFVWGRLRSDLVALIALLVLAFGGVLNTGEALSGFSNPIVIMMIGLFVVGGAIFNTGLAKIIGAKMLALGGGSPVRLFLLVMGATALIGAFISNTATAVLIAPIALQSATALGVSPLPFLFAVTFGASLCFASPFSTPPNALVMHAGQYVFSDYLRVGAPLQLVLGLIMIFVLPVIFPF